MAASRIKGITIEIGGDTTKLQTALKGVNTEIRCFINLFIRNGADLGERLHSVWSKLCYRFNGNKTEAIQR